jgi:hypothetical protein
VGGAIVALGAVAAVVLGSEAKNSTVAPSAAPVITAAEAVSSTTVEPDSPTLLVAEANEAIASLEIDGRDMPIKKPAARIEVDLPAFARGRSELKLDARSQKGSTASLLWSGKGTAHFEFSPAKPVPSGSKTAVRKPTGRGDTPLAKNPYAK